MMGVRVLRRIAACLAAGCILVQSVTAGAAGTESDVEETTTQVTKKIAVLTYSFSSEYWGYVAQGCQACDAGDVTIDIVVEGPSSSVASDEQLILLQSDLKSGRYDGYVIAAIDKAQIEEALKDAKVPVVAIDSSIDAECAIGGIGTNNEAAAAAGAKKAVDMAQKNGWEKLECVMIGGRDDDSNNESRKNGFSKGVTDAGGVWLDQVYSTDKSSESAQEAMRQIMKDHPDGIAVVACYNDNLAEAALAAAKDNKAFENTIFLGFDGIGSMCERMMEDEAYKNLVTVAQNPYEMGFRAVQMMSEHFAKEAAESAMTGDEGDDSGNSAGGSGDTADGSGEANANGSVDGAGDSNDAADESGDAAGGSGQSADKEAETEGTAFLDSGYSVITQANARERIVQIQSHLS